MEKKGGLEAIHACSLLSVTRDEPSWPAFLGKAVSLAGKFTYIQPVCLISYDGIQRVFGIELNTQVKTQTQMSGATKNKGTVMPTSHPDTSLQTHNRPGEPI